jgi:hypothetical protein
MACYGESFTLPGLELRTVCRPACSQSLYLVHTHIHSLFSLFYLLLFCFISSADETAICALF